MSVRRLDLGDGGFVPPKEEPPPPPTIVRETSAGAILRSVQMLICPDCRKRGILPARVNGVTTEFSCECGMIVRTDWSALAGPGVKVIRIGPL